MKFGTVPIGEALGCVLAHSLQIGGHKFPKGQNLSQETIAQLAALGVAQVEVARLGPDDVDENTAATGLASPMVNEFLKATPAFAGRVNLIARTSGVLRIDAAAVDALNGVSESITLACLRDYARVSAGALVCTLKVIPYAVEKTDLNAAATLLGNKTIRLHPFTQGVADLILTRTEGFKESLLLKGQNAVSARLQAMGWRLGTVQIVAHQTETIAAALATCSNDMVLVLGASATSDRMDVVPAAILAAGGEIERFGMPVDPGNLLLLAQYNGRPVVGLPGCLRAPALNGADWVLERLAAGLPVDGRDIASMGVGGLLKEIPQRIQPRRAQSKPAHGKVEVVLLAAGRSSRMQGDHKLLRVVDGKPLLHHTAKTASQSHAKAVHVVVPAQADRQIAALQDLPVNVVVAKDAGTGLSASLRAGMAAVSPDCAAVIVALADMPDVSPSDYNALMAAHAPEAEAYICLPVAPNGKRGNPVLFDQRYFESLSALQGDRGAKALIDKAAEFVLPVPLGAGVLVDLDTVQAWEDWEKARGKSE